MKQIFRYFSVLMVLFVSTMASAQSTIKVMAVTNGTVSVNKTSASWGEIVTVTVTPDEGYYFRINDLEVVKTVNPAATRGDAEIPIANVLTVYDYDPSDLSTTRTYTFQVPGDEYEIQISATFRARTPITDDMVTLYPTSFVYNGSDRMPSVSVSEPVSSNGLIQGVDYTVTFAESAWKDVGTYTIYVNGMSTYKGTVTKTFTISAADGSLIPPSGKSGLVYTGAAQDLVTAGSSTTGTMQYSLDGTNYNTAIPQGTDAKEYTVCYKVVANAGYNDVDPASFKVSIAAKTVSSPTITLSETSYTYDGNAKEPTVTVKDGDTTIPSGEYTVSYSNNTNVGTATVTITDKDGGNYTVSGSTTFTISAADGSLTPPAGKANLVYTGVAQDLITAGSSTTGTMQYSLDGTNYNTAIPQGTDAKEYTVYYKVVANAGYNDVDPASFKVSIAAKTVSSPTITLSETSYTYDGNAKEPTVTVKDGEKTIPSGEYTVSYSNNTNVGTSTVTITDNAGGNYVVNGSTTFTISAADTPDTPEPVVEETPTDDGGKIITTTTTEKLEDGTEKETKVEEKKDADGNVESVSETIKETKTEDDGSSVESTQTTKTDGDGNFVSSETIEEKKDAEGNVEKTTTQAEVPEVSGDAVPVKDETTGKEENYYPASEKTQEKLDKIVGADVAFEENSVQNIQVVETTNEKVTKDGDKSESKSYKLTSQKSAKDDKMSLLGQKKGSVLKATVGKGKLLAFKQKLEKVTKSNTRGEGDTEGNTIEIESGEDYKILQDGDLVLTLKSTESDVEIESISVSEATDEPDEPATDETETIKISSAKQVTFMSDKDLDFMGYPDLKAYVATGYDKASGTIWLTRVKEVPANTGFLLMGEANTYEIPVKVGGSNSYYMNLFKGTIEGKTIYTSEGDNTNYYLSNGESGVGFYKVTKEEGVKLAANRAYLSVPSEISTVGSEGSTEIIKVSAAGQVPYYNSESLDFSSLDAQGVKAYTATGYDYKSGTIWLTRVMKVPAKTGILIMAPKGDYSVPTASVASVYRNMFKGTLNGTRIFTHEEIDGRDYINYYLSNGTSGVGFYKVTKEEGVSLGANRCYLPILNREAANTRSISSEKSFFTLEEAGEVISIPLMRGIGGDEDGTTSIKNLTPALSEGEGAWYTLQGQRVVKPGKGLYIRNGKKVIIR